MQPYLLVQPTGAEPADEWVRLGVSQHSAGVLPKAQEAYHQALRIDPRHAIATMNLAIAYAQSRMMNDALLTVEIAESLDPKHSAIMLNRALIAHESDRVDEALAAAERAVAADPENPATLWGLAIVSAAAGYADRCLPLYSKILEKDPKHPAASPNSCFVQTLTNAGPAELLAQRQRWYNAHRYTGEKKPHTNDKNPDRPLRVGYVGGDFKCHSAAFIFGRVLLHHTPDVEMYLYSTLPVDGAADHRTKAFQEACKWPLSTVDGTMGVMVPPHATSPTRWRDVSTLPDEAVEQAIREDKIDILVDLAGHTNGGRLGLFTRKPAPIQVTAWGFAHGVGCGTDVDYFFADPVAIPERERQHYAETIYDLPCIVTLEPPVEYSLSGVSSPPYKRNGYPTFGTYARYEKLSEECLRAYADILRRVPDSRLVLKDASFKKPYCIKRVLSFMDGIAPERVLFSRATPHNDHLAQYQSLDLYLDCWPHGAGVVAMECLWMGVPILTKYGTQPAGRTAASALTQMGRTNWITYSAEEYVERAVELVDNPKMLADARKTLREELMGSGVYHNYHLAVEAAYRDMWRKWCEKQ